MIGLSNFRSKDLPVQTELLYKWLRGTSYSVTQINDSLDSYSEGAIPFGNFTGVLTENVNNFSYDSGLQKVTLKDDNPLNSTYGIAANQGLLVSKDLDGSDYVPLLTLDWNPTIENRNSWYVSNSIGGEGVEMILWTSPQSGANTVIYNDIARVYSTADIPAASQSSSQSFKGFFINGYNDDGSIKTSINGRTLFSFFHGAENAQRLITGTNKLFSIGTGSTLNSFGADIRMHNYANTREDGTITAPEGLLYVSNNGQVLHTASVKGSYADDTAAGVGGVVLGQLYWNTTNSSIQARLT